jgi:hypothetical protein
MYRIYLDAIAIYHDDSLLRLQHWLVKLIVTSSVRGFIEGQAKSGDGMSMVVLREINEAIDARRVEYMPVDFTDIGLTPGIVAPYADLLAHVKWAIRTYPGDEVRLVAVSGEILEFAKQLGIMVITPEELQKLIHGLEEDDAAKAAEIVRRAQELQRTEWTRVALGVLVGLTAYVVAANFQIIVTTITIWGSIGFIAIAGPCLYALRGRMRMVYGVAEVIVGHFTAANAVLTGSSDRGKEVLALLGGVYIVVRGLDNIGKAAEGTTLERLWGRFSGERRAA